METVEIVRDVPSAGSEQAQTSGYNVRTGLNASLSVEIAGAGYLTSMARFCFRVFRFTTDRVRGRPCSPRIRSGAGPTRPLTCPYLIHWFSDHCSLSTVHCSIHLIFAVLFCNCAFAADWSFTPSVTLSETYNSNLSFSSTSTPGVARSDFITSLKPVISVTGETEATKFQFDTTTTGEKYFENPSLDTINTDTKTSLTKFWSQRFSTEANFRFVHDYTLENELETSGIVTQRAERDQFNIGLGGKYALSESLNVVANGTYTDTTYPSHPVSLVDYTLYQVAITPIWAISPRDNIGLSSNFSWADYPSFSTSLKTITEMLYWERLLTETLNLKLSAGYYFTSSSFVTQVVEFIPPFIPVTVTKPGTATDSGPAAGADLKKDWSERFSTTLSVSKQQYSDPYARSFDKTSVGVTARYGLAELAAFNFRASYDKNNQTSQGTQNIDYVTISPSIERNLRENFIVRLSGSYELETQKNSGGPGIDLDRYRAWVELVYKWPRVLASH